MVIFVQNIHKICSVAHPLMDPSIPIVANLGVKSSDPAEFWWSENFDGSVQDCSNFIANALELL